MKINDVLTESPQLCPECGGPAFSDLLLAEKKDACYHKVKATAKVWPSAYASGRLVQCRKKGAANWGNKSEGVEESDSGDTPIDAMTVQELAEYLGVSEQQVAADVEHARDMAREKAQELTEEFDLIESIIDRLAAHNGVDAEAIWEDLESLSNDELYVFAVTTPLMEDWQKVNKRDRTAGMSRQAVKAYRRENPGSKLKTAVTTKPSKLKRGSKASKRRKSYCSRSRGQMKMHSISCAKTPDKAICKARRRWNCESVDLGPGLAEGSVTKKPQPYNDPDWLKKLSKQQLDALAGSKYKKDKKEQGMAEGKMAELDMDLEDPEISDREFEKIYGMTRKQAREEFSKTNMWDIPDLRDPKRPLHERDVDEGSAKPEINFDIEDIKRLEQIDNLESIKQQAFELISRPSAHPMKPEKVSWFKSALERMDSPMKVIKLMYDLYLSGEGKSVLGTRHSMDPNSYRRRFGESQADDNPVADAIYRRLMNQKPDLFTRYGLEYVAQAVQDVADSVGRLGPDDEIGSSDVSGWVRQVEQNLQDKINQYDEPMSDIDRMEETHRPGHQSSGKNTDDLIGGRYEPDEFDQMVLRLKAMAEKQQRERGPVDLKDLARRLQGIK